jgi:5-formyltetrahydrofolate cyclo-ligase
MVRNGTGGRRHLISSDIDPLALRQALRREMRARRRSLPRVRRQFAERAIVRHLRTHAAYRRARSVALYWPSDGETDIRAIEAHARARGKRLYLPVVGHGGRMAFAPWVRGGRLRRNRYGIPEPAGGRRLPAGLLELLVMPLVAFDAEGNRLGMGGGYYDRALAHRRRRPSLVGIAFACQQAEAIPAQPWDVPLTCVITERGRRARGTRR